MNLFLAQPEDYRYVYPEIMTSYQSNPQLFAQTFFDLLPKLDPKVVRLIGYELYTAGVDFEQLYRARGTDQKAQFLFDLASFPFESMIVLLKYRFPQIIDGDLFFLTSIDQLDLDFYLDLARHVGVDINHTNRSTGGNILHYFVEAGRLPQVELLLCHRVVSTLVDKKGQTPLRIAIDSMDPTNYRHYLQIVRQLARYGARPRDVDRKTIESSPYRIKINQAIQIGATMTPHYCKDHRSYFSLDQVEDLSLIAEVNPEVLNDENFKEMAPGTNFSVLADGIEEARDNVTQADQVIVSWPYYIDTSQDPICEPIEVEATAASPPTARKVYELALRDLTDNLGEVSPPVRAPPVPPIPEVEKWSSDTYYVPTDSGTTFPLPERAISPTGAPPLPSL